MTKNNFSPLIFLASTGAGGIAVGAFVLLQYTMYTGKGLASIASFQQTPLILTLESIMILFTLIHFLLTARFLPKFLSWKKTEDFKNFKLNPLVNTALMAPILSIAMTFNVFIADVRYFAKPLNDNFQNIMLPAFIFYILLWLWTMFKSIELLKISFTQSFDVDKIHFGWLLNPFSLAMTTVTGAGLAAFSKNTETILHNDDIAIISLFLAMVSGTMGLFLLFVKLFSIFKKHLGKERVLENHFMPTYLIVVPILTLYGILILRMGNFAKFYWIGESGNIISTLSKTLLLIFFAFQTWYFAFGLAMIGDYWKKYFRTHFHVSQWGLICPFIGYAVLSGFVFKLFFPNQIFFIFILGMLFLTAFLFLYLLKRQIICCYTKEEHKICDK